MFNIFHGPHTKASTAKEKRDFMITTGINHTELQQLKEH